MLSMVSAETIHSSSLRRSPPLPSPDTPQCGSALHLRGGCVAGTGVLSSAQGGRQAAGTVPADANACGHHASVSGCPGGRCAGASLRQAPPRHLCPPPRVTLTAVPVETTRRTVLVCKPSLLLLMRRAAPCTPAQVYLARTDLEPALYATTSSLRMGANATTEQTVAVTAILDEVRGVAPCPALPRAVVPPVNHPLHRTLV